ncbi:MAG: WD40/YVTN/BNR-like repeat-containing protein, partial [Candidatus Eiseniibacteriota bacterium]
MSRLSVFLAALLVAFLVLTALAPPRTTSPEGQRVSRLAREAMGRIQASGGLEDDADAQAEMEFLMLRDPVRNQIPRGIHQAEMRLARLLPERAVRFYRNGPSGATQAQLTLYQERGPNNVGGRTRAFAIDVSNPTTLLAGSVAGGMWRSTDDGASWSATTAPGQIHSTTCIAQDRRAGQSGTWYVGSGEVRGSTTNATRWGALYLGDGIFKSIDGGQSWTLLASTSSGTPQTVDPFDYVNNIATNPANLAQDEVLAATYRGIYRSVDGGSSWLQVIAADSGYTDIAITPAGAMYATTRNSGLIRVWRSTNGTSWSAIQPPTFPTVANRVVIGLAPSNPAIAYVFAQGVNAASVAGHQLWRYTYVSGDGSGAGGTWTELTANLPSDLNTQTGYDQIVHVKPDDENFVIIGGTNLYRSTTGFATNVVTT